MDETVVSSANHRPITSYWLPHIKSYQVHFTLGENRTHNFKTYILSNSACWIYVCVTTTGSTLLVNWQCHVMRWYYMLTDTVTCWVDLAGWLTASVTCWVDIIGRLPVSRPGSTLLVHCLCHRKFYAPTFVWQGHLDRTSSIYKCHHVVDLLIDLVL